MKSTYTRGLVLLLILAYFGQGMVQAQHASITFDEGLHQMVGYITLRTGDLRIQPVHIHPPLANELAGAPLLLQSDLPDPRTIEGWEIASLSALADATVWRYPHPARLAIAGRLPILLMGVLLGAVVFRWASEYGTGAGLLALALFAFDPNLVAHGALITTDMAATLLTFATLFALARWMQRPDRRPWGLVCVGLLLGLAQLVKVSALLLIPLVGFLILLQAIAQHASDLPRLARHLLRACAIVFGVAALVLWAGYAFDVGSLPGLPFPVPAATHVKIFQSLRTHYDDGHPAFLMGQFSKQGWWWYFPAAFLLKTPIPVLVLALWALVLTLTQFLRHPSSLIHSPKPKIQRLPSTLHYLPLLLFPLGYAFASLFSTVNIGYRHLLPILPFLYVAIASPLQRLPPTIQRPSSAIQALLLLWLAAGTLASAPYPMTYFNELAGGPANGYRYLVDSNLDWGQSLWELRRWMAEHNVDRVKYAHYSPARPAAYGIDVDFLPPHPSSRDYTPWRPAPGIYAIGATVLQGPYAPDLNTYAWFRSREPAAKLANGLFVYEVAATPPPAWAVLCDSAGTGAEAVRERLDLPDLRVIPLACAQARVRPAERPGVVVAPPAVPPPADARLEVALRDPAGHVAAAVYRVDAAPEHAPAAAALEGPLTFLGAEVIPGSPLLLRTTWRVDELTGRPLSLIAHLIAPEGHAAAVGDRLSYPIEFWRPGDVFTQTHTLVLPEGLAPGTYTLHTGAYWLDTLERWPVTVKGAGPSDVITVAEVQLP